MGLQPYVLKFLIVFTYKFVIYRQILFKVGKY